MKRALSYFVFLLVIGCAFDGTGPVSSSGYYGNISENVNEDLHLSVSSYPKSIVPGETAKATVSFVSNPDISSSDVSVTVTNSYGTEVASSDMDANVTWFSDMSSGTIELTLFGSASYSSYTFTVTVKNGYDTEFVSFTSSTTSGSVEYSNSVVLGNATPAVCTTGINSSDTVYFSYRASPSISRDSLSILIVNSDGNEVFSSFELDVEAEWFLPDTMGIIPVSISGEGYSDWYRVYVTASNGDVKDRKSFTVINGAQMDDTGFTTVKTSEYIYDSDGNRAGAFDLVNGTTLSGGATNPAGDLIDLSDGYEGTTGQLSSANGARFGYSILNFDNATAEEVVDEASVYALEPTTDELFEDDVICVKLGYNRGYAIVKVLEVDKSWSATGGGFIRFAYKLVSE